MRTLHRKLLRDLVHMKGQATAIGMVIACGVATFVMSLSMLDSLTGTLDGYYEGNRFAQIFAHLERAPLGLQSRIAEIPGVAHVETRVVERVTLDMPGLREPASGRLVSLPRDLDDPRDGLNLLYLRAGRFPRGARSREVLVSQRFAEEHQLDPGDGVEAILNGRLETLRVVGIALSPEYIYLIAPGGLFPDNTRFGVFWMARDEMEAAFDMEGAFNDVTLSLMPHASGPEVIARLDELTAAYGGLGAYDREDQTSHKFVANEIKELRGMALMVPAIFLGVAAFLLNIVLSRMITTQREQIAALKALGYNRLEIGRHYFAFVMLITAVAVAVGSAAGAWMGHGMTALYGDFFDFPSFQYTLHPRVILLAFGVSAAAASIGVAHAVRAAVRLPPAEAMRPQAPPSFRPTLLERLGFDRFVSPAVRMIVRQLERRPIKTSLSILGIALAAAILVVGSSTEDAIDELLDFEFHRVQQYDVDVVLADQSDDTALSSIRHIPGVRTLEPYGSLAARIHRGHRHRRIGVLGLARADGLHRMLDMRGHAVSLPDHGIVLSTMLADLLDVKVGDEVRLDVLQGRRPTFTTHVAGLIEDFSGLSAYMNMDAMNRLMRDVNTIGGAYVSVDPASLDDLYNELHNAPRVAAVNVKSATVETFRETIAENLTLMRSFFIGFSVVIAFGVIYNSARISLSERSRDLATLRVIGFTRGEVSAIQLGELAILTGIAIPIGLALGAALAWLTSVSMDSELIRIPFVVARSTFAMAALVVMGATLVSALIIRARLEELDLISVLKSRE